VAARPQILRQISEQTDFRIRDFKTNGFQDNRKGFIMAIQHSDATSTAGAMVVRHGEGQTLRWGPAGRVRILAGASTTDGSFSIVESTEPPGSGAPLHVHHGEAEGFYILEGALELTCGAETLTAGAGDFVYTPKDVAHKYVVTGEKPARLLLLFSRPGFEMFFAEGGSPLDRPAAAPPNPDAFRRLVEKYDMELLQMPAH
jgi:mannose-6-phosphate isomerase-like protein (cupin superfamily)